MVVGKRTGSFPSDTTTAAPVLVPRGCSMKSPGHPGPHPPTHDCLYPPAVFPSLVHTHLCLPHWGWRNYQSKSPAQRCCLWSKQTLQLQDSPVGSSSVVGAGRCFSFPLSPQLWYFCQACFQLSALLGSNQAILAGVREGKNGKSAPLSIRFMPHFLLGSAPTHVSI